MTELSDAARPALAPLRRFWWVVLLLAVVAGASAFVTSQPAGAVTYGVVNTRSVASLPNDRLDLINDLRTAATLPSVLDRPAEVAGMSVSELRDAITIERIESTTLARITFSSEIDSDETNQRVITTLVEEAGSFLGQSQARDGERVSPPLRAAREAEAEAAEAVAAVVDANGGLEPDERYRALQASALNVPASELLPGQAALRRSRLRAAFEEAQAYEALVLERTRASNAVTSLEATYVQREAQQASLAAGVPVSFEGDVPSAGDVTARARRVLAAAAAGALLGAFLVMLLGTRRRHRA